MTAKTESTPTDAVGYLEAFIDGESDRYVLDRDAAASALTILTNALDTAGAKLAAVPVESIRKVYNWHGAPSNLLPKDDPWRVIAEWLARECKA